jgi:hypothetical protein
MVAWEPIKNASGKGRARSVNGVIDLPSLIHGFFVVVQIVIQ